MKQITKTSENVSSEKPTNAIEALGKLRQDAEIEILNAYPDYDVYPDMKRRYDRDMSDLDDLIKTIRAELEQAQEDRKAVRYLADILLRIKNHTDCDDPESYRCDDREGCLDTVHSLSEQALTTHAEAIKRSEEDE